MNDAVYQARCWAEGKPVAEIRAEIVRVEQKARTHHYAWNEVGCVTWDWQRVDTLRAIIGEEIRPRAEVRIYGRDDYRRKADQEWDLAGQARHDGDWKDSERHTAKAREYEQRWRELA